MVMVPYNAIIPELTTLYEERNNLSGIRGALSTTSSLLSAVIPAMIIAQFTDKGVGHMIMAAIFGLFYSLPFIGVFFVSYERPEYQKSELLPFWQSFKESMMNRSFRLLLGLYIFAYVSLDILMATFLYFLTYILGKQAISSTLLGIMLITQVLFLPLYVYLGNRISKSKALLIGMCFWAVLMASGWFFTADTSTTALYVYAFLLGISISPVGFMPWAMLPDITDVDELMTGRRREGIYVGFMTFLRKISAGIALALLGFSLDLAHYIPDVPMEEQTGSAVLAIRILFAVVPVAMIACSVYFSARFPLTGYAHKVCMNEVKRRRGEEYEDMGLTPDEKHDILRSLVGPSYVPRD
jgi:oligogalacturonide transporter